MRIERPALPRRKDYYFVGFLPILEGIVAFPPETEHPDLAELPESIGKLTSLTRLEVQYNQLTSEFPRTFPTMGQLAVQACVLVTQ